MINAPPQQPSHPPLHSVLDMWVKGTALSNGAFFLEGKSIRAQLGCVGRPLHDPTCANSDLHAAFCQKFPFSPLQTQSTAASRAS